MENSNVFPVFDFVLKQIFKRLLFISTQETAYDTCVCDKKQVVLSGGMAARLVQEENSSSRPASSDTFFRKRSMENGRTFSIRNGFRYRSVFASNCITACKDRILPEAGKGMNGNGSFFLSPGNENALEFFFECFYRGNLMAGMDFNFILRQFFQFFFQYGGRKFSIIEKPASGKGRFFKNSNGISFFAQFQCCTQSGESSSDYRDFFCLFGKKLSFGTQGSIGYRCHFQLLKMKGTAQWMAQAGILTGTFA